MQDGKIENTKEVLEKNDICYSVIKVAKGELDRRSEQRCQKIAG